VAYAIRISLSERQLYLLQDGKTIKNYPVGVGKFETPTPLTTTSIATKKPNPGGPFGTMWLGLAIPHYGIHGTNNPSSIGGYVSHGCIRMYNQDVLGLATLLPIGTPVFISA